MSFPYPDFEFQWRIQTTDHEIVIDQVGTYWVPTGTRERTAGKGIRYAYPSPNVWMTADPARVHIQRRQLQRYSRSNQGKEDYVEAGYFQLLGKRVADYGQYNNYWQSRGLENGLYWYILTSRVSGRSLRGWLHILR